jgi:hypothetical protein
MTHIKKTVSQVCPYDYCECLLGPEENCPVDRTQKEGEMPKAWGKRVHVESTRCTKRGDPLSKAGYLERYKIINNETGKVVGTSRGRY